MAKASGGNNTETIPGQFRETGFELSMRYAREQKIGGVVVLFKGGLGDPNSKSMEVIAKTLYEMSDGKVNTGTVATTRKHSPLKALFGSSRAPKHRSQSLKGSSDIVNDTLHPGLLMFVGQSQGGINVVKAAVYQVDHPQKNAESPRLAVETIDAPGMYEPHEFEEEGALALGKFALHCMGDIHSMPVRDRVKITAKVAQSTSLLELPYFIGESVALQGIDVSSDVEYLRARGVHVGHIWHRDDMVPGASMACDNSLVLSGGHMTFMREPEPIAQHLIETIARLQDRPLAA